MDYPIRINKYIRDRGLASRREADKLVDDGLVLINGKISEKGDMVNKEDHVVLKENKKEYKYIAYYKPCGLSTQDHPGKRSVITDWEKEGVYPVGRLDKDSEGLLILTNDGRFAREVLSRKKDYEKEYIVTVREKLHPSVVRVFGEGIKSRVLGNLLPVKSEIVSDKTIRMILNEGKRHQIRIMLNDLSYTVVSLKRVRIGNIFLNNLNPGESKEFNR